MMLHRCGIASLTLAAWDKVSGEACGLSNPGGADATNLCRPLCLEPGAGGTAIESTAFRLSLFAAWKAECNGLRPAFENQKGRSAS